MLWSRYYFYQYIFLFLDIQIHMLLVRLSKLDMDSFHYNCPYKLFYLVINSINMFIYILEGSLEFNNINILLDINYHSKHCIYMYHQIYKHIHLYTINQIMVKRMVQYIYPYILILNNNLDMNLHIRMAYY